MTAQEIATQLTLALISKNNLYDKYETGNEVAERKCAERVGKAFDVILTEVVKALDNANKVIPK